jgi:hypothetical protein
MNTVSRRDQTMQRRVVSREEWPNVYYNYAMIEDESYQSDELQRRVRSRRGAIQVSSESATNAA